MRNYSAVCALICCGGAIVAMSCARPLTDIVATDTEDVGDYQITPSAAGDTLTAMVCIVNRSKADAIAERVIHELLNHGFHAIALDIFAPLPDGRAERTRVRWTPYDGIRVAERSTVRESSCQPGSVPPRSGLMRRRGDEAPRLLLIAAGRRGSGQRSAPSSHVDVVGCLQRGSRDIATGARSSIGWMLVDASITPFGGADDSPAAGVPPPLPDRERTGREDATRSGGPSYVLDGNPALVAKHGGERVLIRGTLLPAGPSSSPQRLRVESVRTVARRCSAR
jgi:hypothetical protein